jgi:hypothetical protein
MFFGIATNLSYSGESVYTLTLDEYTNLPNEAGAAAVDLVYVGF